MGKGLAAKRTVHHAILVLGCDAGFLRPGMAFELGIQLLVAAIVVERTEFSPILR